MSKFKSNQAIATARPPAARPRATPYAPSPPVPLGGSIAQVNLAPQGPMANSSDSAAVRVGFIFAALYVLALFSMATEFSLSYLGIKPYITWITGPLAIVAVIASGDLAKVWRPGPGRWLILFSLWMTLGIPFSIFRGGSFATMQEFLERQFPVMIMMAVLVSGLARIEWLVRSLAFSSLLVLLISVKYGGVSDNRLMIPGTSLENPNDFATHLLLGLPFCLLLVLNSKNWVLRLLGVAGLGGSVLTILRTGSRGALISLVAIVIVLVWKSPTKQRVGGIAVVVLCALTAVAMFPSVVWDRFATIFSTGVESTADVSQPSTVQLAEASTNGRWYTFKRSLEFTVQNPIFGVGAGNYPVAENGIAAAEGSRGAWLGTHNSYTQASSEGGIPAFLFFAAAIFSSIRINSRIHTRTYKRAEYRKVANTALCLMLTVIGFGVSVLFCHLAFRYYLPMLVGITLAFSGAVNALMRNDNQDMAAGGARFLR